MEESMPEPLEISHTPLGSSHSELFTVRIWREDLGEGRVEWRGYVEHVTSGLRRYFRDWAALSTLIQEMLPEGVNQVRSPP
jgi:hypothetical protein